MCIPKTKSVYPVLVWMHSISRSGRNPPSPAPGPARSPRRSRPQDLAALREARALCTLELDLEYNAVGDAGARALVALRDLPRLKDLRLDLEYSGVGARGAAALAELRHAPALETLRLNLRRNEVRDAGAEALAALWETPGLRALHLHLEGNQVFVWRGCGGVCPRAPFTNSAPLGGGGIALEGRGGTPPPQGAQPTPGHCPPNGNRQLQWHL